MWCFSGREGQVSSPLRVFAGAHARRQAARGVAAAIAAGCIVTACGRQAHEFGVARVSASEDHWEPAGRMDASTQAHGILLRSGSVLMAGGSADDRGRTAEVFDPTSVEWTPTGSMAVGRLYPGLTLLADGRVLVSGGYNRSEGLPGISTPSPGLKLPSTTAELFDPESGSFSDTGDLVDGQRFGHAAVTMQDGRVLIAGGQNVGGPLRSAEIYDPSSGLWRRTADMATARYHPAAALLQDGRVLVAGGSASETASIEFLRGQTSVEAFDPQTEQWLPLHPMNEARFWSAAALLHDGRVLVAGAILLTEHIDDTYPSAEIYDPTSNTWVPTSPMAGPADYESDLVELPSGRALFVSPEGILNEPSHAELYIPQDDEWQEAPQPEARRSASLTVLRDGRCLLVGGAVPQLFVEGQQQTTQTATPTSGPTLTATPADTSAPPTPTDTLEPTTAPPPTDTRTPTVTPTSTPPAYGVWSSTGSMIYPREQHSAVALPDGRVLVAGGVGSGSTYPKTAELYDPTTNEWSEAGEMSSARLRHTALLLADGRVLVIGGYDPTGSPEAPSWPPPDIFDPVSGTWSALPTDVQGNYGSSQVLLPDGRVLLSGLQQSRFCNYYGNSLSKTILLDLATGTSIPGPDMQAARIQHWTAELADGTVLLGGGLATHTDLDGLGRCDIVPGPQRLVEVFDPATGSLRQLAALPQDPVRDVWRVPNGNSNHQLRLEDGGIMVTNGLDDTYTPARLPPLLYSPAEDSWSTIPWGSVGRTNPLASLLPNGFVLFVSGRKEDSPTARSAELYDPVSGRWLWAGEARHQYTALYDTATTLRDGRVLVVGSPVSSRGGDDRAEVYEFTEPFRGRVYIPIACTD